MRTKKALEAIWIISLFLNEKIGILSILILLFILLVKEVKRYGRD